MSKSKSKIVSIHDEVTEIEIEAREKAAKILKASLLLDFQNLLSFFPNGQLTETEYQLARILEQAQGSILQTM